MAQKARVVVSIDLCEPPGPQEASFVNDTAGLLNEISLPATWATPTPTQAKMGRILGGSAGHEIALTATDAWATTSDRTLFANVLSQRIAKAAENGISIQTLAASPKSIEGRLDLLVKHRLTSLRLLGGVVDNRGELARYGVNIAPESTDVHADYAWWTGGPRAAVRRALHASIQKSEIAHIAIDVRQVVQANRQQVAWAAIEDAANRVRFGLAQAITLRQLTSRHRVIRTGTGRSILRAA